MSEAGVRFVSIWMMLTIVAIALGALSLHSQSVSAQETGFSLRMYGNGVRAPGQDRVLIPIDNPERPADIGATDFTIEFWIRALPDANRGVARCNENDGWIYGNVVVDRDIYGGGDYGDFGVSIGDGRIVFGVSVGNNGTSLCSNQRIDDGEWHHVAATRRLDGAMQLFINGASAGSTQGAPGNASYRNNRSTSYPADPFIVLGAEKHDAGAEYPSFNGWIDELRLSNAVRYSVGFVRPAAPFVADSQTVALYHFDEGPAGACTGVIRDSSGATGGPSDGQCVFGGSPAGPEYVTDTPFTGGSMPTATPTGVATATNTPAPPTATNTATATASNTPAPPTATNTATATASNTPAPPTATNTATATASNTPTSPTATNTATATASNTPVPPTATNTATATASNTPVPPTATNTATATASNTPVPPTATNTATATASNTPTSPTATNTATATATNTPVPPTATNTATATASNTPVPPTATSAATNTPTLPTATGTSTWVSPTATATASYTPSPQPTATSTMTATATDTPIPPTATNTVIPTLTSIPTVTDTPTPLSSETIPMTPTETPVGSATDEITPTLTPTLSPCPTVIATPVATPDETPVEEPVFDVLWSFFFPLILHEDPCAGITR